MTRPMPIYTESTLTPEPWVQDASCVETDPEVFFPDKGGTAVPAKSVCAGCAVDAECLAYALRTGQTYGVWGGKTPAERRALGAARLCQDCGADISDRSSASRYCVPCGLHRRGRRAA